MSAAFFLSEMLALVGSNNRGDDGQQNQRDPDAASGRACSRLFNDHGRLHHRLFHSAGRCGGGSGNQCSSENEFFHFILQMRARHRNNDSLAPKTYLVTLVNQ